MPQNYQLNCYFDVYEPGKIVPAHVVEVGHDVRKLVERGLVTPTDKPVNVPLVKPKATAATSPDDVVSERNRLADENKSLREENAKLRGHITELEKSRDAFRDKCNEYTEGIAHLTAATEDHQRARDVLEKRVAELTADLEAATAPATRPVSAAKSFDGILDASAK